MSGKTSGFGIIGLACELPAHVRTNDWWPESFVQALDARAARDIVCPEVRLARAETPRQRIQIQAMLPYLGDPFRGAKERRIADPGETSFDYALRAAEKALADAGVEPRDIDLVLLSSLPARHWQPGQGPELCERLGARHARVVPLDEACAAFMTGLALADAMLSAGQARCALVVATALTSRVMDWDDAASVNFGDAAAAAVLGPTAHGLGFLAHAAGVDGTKCAALTIGPRTAEPWYRGGGPFVVHPLDVALGRSVVMRTTEYAELAVQSVLERAGFARGEVTHLYCHQPSVWFHAACVRALGMEHCQTLDTFTRYGSAGAANVGLNLQHAREAGQLAAGDAVLLFSFGMGVTWGSSLMRWAR